MNHPNVRTKQFSTSKLLHDCNEIPSPFGLAVIIFKLLISHATEL